MLLSWAPKIHTFDFDEYILFVLISLYYRRRTIPRQGFMYEISLHKYKVDMKSRMAIMESFALVEEFLPIKGRFY